MNILAVAPHPDDESIGCGGTLRRHVERGDRVVAVFLTSGELGIESLPPAEARAIREEEAAEAAEILGLAAIEFLRLPDWFLGDDIPRAAVALAPILQREHPGILYAPHLGETHPDHRASIPIVRAALSLAPVPALALRTYEIWTPLAVYEEVEDITETMAHKLRAIRRYHSQLASFRYDRAVRGLGAYRGALAAKCEYAEVFGSGPVEHVVG